VRFDDTSDLDRLLFTQADVLTRAQALRFFSEGAVRHRLVRGIWRRMHPGVYLTTTADPTHEQQLWIAVLAAGETAVLGGLSALTHQYRVPLAVSGVHVLISGSSHGVKLPIGVVAHRTNRLREPDVHRLGSPPCTMPERSTVDAAAWARSDREAILIVTTAFQRQLLTLESLRRVLDRMQTVKRRPVILRAALDAEGASHSMAEAEYLRLNRAQRLPEPSRQHRRLVDGGRPRYLDIYYERFRVHVEIDGAQHRDVQTAWDDMRRQNEVWIAGDRVLRFPGWLIRTRPEEVFSQVRAALKAAGWAG
jgi:very-short-patch-repair endonuclease